MFGIRTFPARLRKVEKYSPPNDVEVFGYLNVYGYSLNFVVFRLFSDTNSCGKAVETENTFNPVQLLPEEEFEEYFKGYILVTEDTQKVSQSNS